MSQQYPTFKSLRKCFKNGRASRIEKAYNTLQEEFLKAKNSKKETLVNLQKKFTNFNGFEIKVRVKQ